MRKRLSRSYGVVGAWLNNCRVRRTFYKVHTYLKKYGRGAGASLTNGAAHVVALVFPDGALDTQTSVFRDGVVALIRVAGEH